MFIASSVELFRKLLNQFSSIKACSKAIASLNLWKHRETGGTVRLLCMSRRTETEDMNTEGERGGLIVYVKKMGIS